MDLNTQEDNTIFRCACVRVKVHNLQERVELKNCMTIQKISIVVIIIITQTKQYFLKYFCAFFFKSIWTKLCV